MIRRLAAVLRPADPADRDAGLSLVEVIVAMMVFSVIAVGMAFTITNSLVITRDSRARAIATNLAAQDLDLMRAQTNYDAVAGTPTDLVSVVGGITFTTRRVVSLVPASADRATTDSCGASTTSLGGGSAGALQYKSVRTTVDYGGRKGFAKVVTADTVIAPPERITDVDSGAIIVSVSGASGAGTAGVSPVVTTASPANGAASLGAQPAATDAQGCSYALKVKPGNYLVKLSTSGYVSNEQVAAPVVPVTVTAGRSATARFAYDRSLPFTLRYAANLPAGQPAPLVPSGMPTTFAASAVATKQLVVPTTGQTGTQRLYPTGYNVIAGPSSSLCLSTDPGNWSTPVTALAPGAPPVGAVGRQVPTSVSPDAPVGMGVVQVKVPLGSGGLTATLQSAGAAGDPGCESSANGGVVSYSFPGSAGSTVTLALPYGTWRFTSRALVGLLTTSVGQDAVAPLTPAWKPGNDLVVLDPRTVAP